MRHEVKSPLHRSPTPTPARAGAQEDVDLITLLVSASGHGPKLLIRDVRWHLLETSPDNIIVGSCDVLARISNELIPTTHRVINPARLNVSRYSMPFFMMPNPYEVLPCLPSCRDGGVK